jgi:SAM-dependent methyltransferase
MLKKIIKHIKSKTLLSAIRSKLLKIKKNKRIPWQLKIDMSSKFYLIKPILKEMQVKSILDIGCNAGVLTRLSGSSGFFSVGIDREINFYGIKEPLKNVCIGNIELSVNLIEKLPVFDSIFLLSFHHILIKKYGDKYTRNIIANIAKKTKKVLFLEFAALNRKYSDRDILFSDNDDNSIIKYASDWLETTLPEFSITYIGKTAMRKVEHYRYMFACKRKENIPVDI